MPTDSVGLMSTAGLTFFKCKPSGGGPEKKKTPAPAPRILGPQWPHCARGGTNLRVVAPPAQHEEYHIAKPQAVLMDCTAVPPKDTRGQEALTQKLRLNF